jgi:hypothetical protein
MTDNDNLTSIDIADLARITGGDNLQATEALVGNNGTPACDAAHAQMARTRGKLVGTAFRTRRTPTSGPSARPCGSVAASSATR